MPLRPLGLSDVLDGAFKLLRANAATVLAVTAVFVVPVNVAASFLSRAFLDGISLSDAINDPAATETAIESGSGEEALAFLVNAVATAVVLPLVAGAISRIVATAYLGRQEPPSVALRVVGRRAVALVVAWVVVHVVEMAPFLILAAVVMAAWAAGGIGGAAVAVLVAGAVAGVAWLVVALARLVAVAPAIVEEGLGPLAGVGRSNRLVRGRTGPVLAVALVSGLLATILDSVLAAPFQFAGFAVGIDGWGWVLVAAGGIVSQLVTTPFIAIVATLVYFDARIRTEGLDLELMAAELEGASPVGGRPGPVGSSGWGSPRS